MRPVGVTVYHCPTNMGGFSFFPPSKQAIKSSKGL